jgi:hypothetical protein
LSLIYLYVFTSPVIAVCGTCPAGNSEFVLLAVTVRTHAFTVKEGTNTADATKMHRAC